MFSVGRTLRFEERGGGRRGKILTQIIEQIKVWDLKTYQCVTTLKGHNHWVRALAIDRAPGGRLYR